MPQDATPNLSECSIAFLNKLSAGPTELFHHGFAILHAPAYRQENASALRQDWPRIPLPDSRELLLASAAMGRKIAALLDTETPFELAAPLVAARGGLAQRPLLRKIAVPMRVDKSPLDVNEDLAVTAGWGHAGKGRVTMPGKV